MNGPYKALIIIGIGPPTPGHSSCAWPHAADGLTIFAVKLLHHLYF